MKENDLHALARHLPRHIASLQVPLRAERLAGGQSNPTFRLTDASGKHYVLRKKPEGVLKPSSHAIEREFRVISALAGTGVPVAPAHYLCEDHTVLGTPFYVMGFVDGRVFWDPTLPNLSKRDRAALYDDINQVIARMHCLDPAAHGLGDYGQPMGHIARQIASWSRRYRAAETLPQPAMHRLMEWLPEHAPQSDVVSLVHGDFRLDNLMIHPTEPRVVAILDWELSTLGDPLADFNYHMLTWYLTNKQFRGMAQADLTALAIPDAGSYLAAYVAITGCPAPSPRTWETYTIYNLFRLAAILQGIARRAENGTAVDAKAVETGALARPIGELAWRRAEKLTAAH